MTWDTDAGSGFRVSLSSTPACSLYENHEVYFAQQRDGTVVSEGAPEALGPPTHFSHRRNGIGRILRRWCDG